MPHYSAAGSGSDSSGSRVQPLGGSSFEGSRGLAFIPHAGLSAVGEFDAGGLEGALYGVEIIHPRDGSAGLGQAFVENQRDRLIARRRD